MKKLLSVLLAAMLVMALCVTSFAAPTIDYVFKSETDYYLFGSTDSVVDDLGVEISSANVKAQTITFSEDGTPELLNTLNDVKKFGFKIGNPEDVIGNTIAFKPYHKIGDEVTEGKIYSAVGSENAAVTSYPINQYYNYGAAMSNSNASYPVKATNLNGGSLHVYPDYPMGYLLGYATSTTNNRIGIMQFVLTDDMLDAEELSISFGANAIVLGATANNMLTKINTYSPEYTVYEVTNLNNTWSDRSARSDMCEGNLELTEIVTLTKADAELCGNSSQYDSSSAHYAGVRFNGGGATFTNYIKAKINAGCKVVNLAVQLKTYDNTVEGAPASFGFCNTCECWLDDYTNPSSKYGDRTSGGRSALEPFYSAIRW